MEMIRIVQVSRFSFGVHYSLVTWLYSVTNDSFQFVLHISTQLNPMQHVASPGCVAITHSESRTMTVMKLAK